MDVTLVKIPLPDEAEKCKGEIFLNLWVRKQVLVTRGSPARDGESLAWMPVPQPQRRGVC